MHDFSIKQNAIFSFRTSAVFNFWHGPVSETPSTPLEKRLKISKIANFESDTFSASEDIALQVAKFYRRLYGGGGGGQGLWRDLIAPESHILNLNPRRILNRLV